MARIRTVKPDFFRHDLLQDLEITHKGKCCMLVFSGLWGHCDKAGRFRWRPKHLKLDILPFLPFDMAETMTILEQARQVVRYEVGGEEYGWIPTFTEHQRISGKEAQEPERYPPPPREAIERYEGSNGEAIEKQSRRQEGKGMEGNGDVGVSASPALPLGAVNGNAVCYIPLNDGTEFGVSKELSEELGKLYPRVDVPQTLNEIRGWNLANPTRKKTRRGVLSHINAWMQKEQNRGPQTR